MRVPKRSKHYYEKRLRNKVGEAIHDFRMIEHGDRVMVALSGGKDSLVLMKILSALRKAAPIEYELIPVHVATGYEMDFPLIAEWVRDSFGLEVFIYDAQISQILNLISDPEKSPCALCSRLRRGKLYALAEEMGVSSIALGHHMDDIIETFFLRCFYTGQIGAMAPSRYSNDNKNRVIRPLAYCTSEMVDAYFNYLDIAPVTQKCPIRPDSRRKLIRGHLERLEKDIPMVKYSLFASLSNIDMKSLCLKGNDHADHH